MPATLGRLFIDPGGISTVINITGPAGGLLTTYTAVNGGTATSFPNTISTITEYNFVEIIPATISAKVNGVESANGAGGTLTVNMGVASAQGISTGFSDSEVATAVAGLGTISGNLTLADGDNLIIGTSTGTKIGTATGQKIAFYNATPVVQQLATADLGTALSNLGLRAAGTAYPITTSGAVGLSGQVTITDVDVALGATTGTKIGTATTQKLAFYNATPVVQPAGSTDVVASLVTLGLRGATSNPPLNLGTGAITAGAIGGAALTVTSIAGTGTVALTDNMTITDAKNIIAGSSTGNQIGTAITQKLGFYGVTPIAQRAGAAQAAVVGTGSTITTPYGYATAAQADAIVTLVNELRAWAIAQGFIKGAS